MACVRHWQAIKCKERKTNHDPIHNGLHRRRELDRADLLMKYLLAPLLSPLVDPLVRLDTFQYRLVDTGLGIDEPLLVSPCNLLSNQPTHDLSEILLGNHGWQTVGGFGVLGNPVVLGIKPGVDLVPQLRDAVLALFDLVTEAEYIFPVLREVRLGVFLARFTLFFPRLK